MKPTEIFGLVDEALDSMEANERQVVPKKKKIMRPTTMPNMKVKRSRPPSELRKVDAANVVYVPTATLRRVANNLTVETKKLNSLLLNKLTPLLLSYQTSTKYASAAVKEGLDVDLEFDPGMLDCIQHIGYLNVVMHFIKSSQLPTSIKQRFMRRFSDLIAEHSVAAMVNSNKAQAHRAQLQELQAVVYSRQKNKTEVKKPVEEEPKAMKTAVRRSRR